MKMTPLVSVIIPAYNNYKWLEAAVKSVLEQTFNNYEIIIVDDGSQEDLSHIKHLNPNKILYYKNKNNGVGYSRNFGIKKATGKYVAFLDSDDFWDRRKLEIQIQELEASKYVWSQHNYYYYDDAKCMVINKIKTIRYLSYYKYAIFCSFKVQTSCFIANRQALIDNDCFFDENKSVGEDVGFYIKMMKKFPLQFVDEYLSYFRIRDNNSGFDARKQIFSRAMLWLEHQNDKYVRDHMSTGTVLAYKWCSIANRFSKINGSKRLALMVYLIPWLIFKIEDFRYYLYRAN